MSAPTNDWVVGLGGNVGAVETAFALAGALISRQLGPVVAMSAIYETAPVGPAQPDYRNAALRVKTTLDPSVILERLLHIERLMGRDRDNETRWGPRTLDLDLLHGFETIVDLPNLSVPHARLHERAFALAPLLDVAPELAERYRAALDEAGGRPEAARVAAVSKKGGHRVRVFAEAPLDAVCTALNTACAARAPLDPDQHVVLMLEVDLTAPDALLERITDALGDDGLAGVHIGPAADDGRARVAVFRHQDAYRPRSLRVTIDSAAEGSASAMAAAEPPAS